MKDLSPENHADAVALFRSEIVGALTRRDQVFDKRTYRAGDIGFPRRTEVSVESNPNEVDRLVNRRSARKVERNIARCTFQNACSIRMSDVTRWYGTTRADTCAIRWQPD
jgi:hypothetical protein